MSTLYVLAFGVVLGFVGCLYLLSHRQGTVGKAAKVSFFLNIIIKNREAMLKKNVAGKIDEKLGASRTRIGSGIRGLVGKAAGTIVSHAVGDEKMSSLVGTKMAENIPKKLEEKMGLKAEAKCRFVHGPLAVLQVTIRDVDLDRFATIAGGAKASSALSKMLDMLSGIGLKSTAVGAAKSKVAAVVAQKMQENMPAEITQNMKEEGGLEVEITTKSTNEQAEFLFCLLEEHP